MVTRIQEPEKMTDEEESLYATADYSIPHEIFITDVLNTVKEKNNATAIDLGCGPGDILLRLRRYVNWSLWGVDLSPGMLTIALDNEKKHPSANKLPINWVLADVKNIGLPPTFFDLIISNSVLHHLADPHLFWRQIKKIARSGSFVFVRDLRRPINEKIADELVLKHVGNEASVVQAHYRSSLFSAYTVSEIEAQLKKAKLKGLIVRELDDRYLDISGQLTF